MKKIEIGTRVVLDSTIYGIGIEGRISNIQTDFKILWDCEKVIFDTTNFEKLSPHFKERYLEDGCLVLHHRDFTVVTCRLNRKAR